MNAFDINYINITQQYQIRKKREIKNFIRYFFYAIMILGKEKRRKIVLVQEWVNNSKEIYKIYPKEHVQIIGNIIKTLSKDKFVIDIMSKNWLISEDNNLYYVDLILFNPKDQLSDQIKRLANELL